MPKKYVAMLNDEQRFRLHKLIRRGRELDGKLNHARVLLNVDQAQGAGQ